MFPFTPQPNPPYPHQDPYQTPQQQQQQPSSSQQARERDPPRDPSVSPHRPIGPIGAPLHFTTGQFIGKHIRAELIELQKADLGRKYVPRHPILSVVPQPSLDMLARTADRLIHRPSCNSSSSTRSPVPTDPMQRLIITSCAFCLLASSFWLADSSRVSLYREIHNMGLICHVDLFPVPGDSDDSVDSKRRQDPAQSSPSRASTSTMSPTPYSPNTQQYPYTYPAPQPPAPFSPGVSPQGAPLGNMPSVHSNNMSPQQQAQAQDHPYPPQPPSNPTRPEEIVHYFKGTHVITEGSKQTESLAGTTFVQAANLDYKGNKVLMFVFAVCIFPSLPLPACPRFFVMLVSPVVLMLLLSAIGSRGKGRRELYTTISLFRPFLSCRKL
jgi:hypothetical protein